MKGIGEKKLTDLKFEPFSLFTPIITKDDEVKSTFSEEHIGLNLLLEVTDPNTKLIAEKKIDIVPVAINKQEFTIEGYFLDDAPPPAGNGSWRPISIPLHLVIELTERQIPEAYVLDVLGALPKGRKVASAGYIRRRLEDLRRMSQETQ